MVYNREWFHGKVAFVTGSGRGLGRHYALYLANLGCDVVIHDVDESAAGRYGEAESLAQTVNEIKALGRRSMAVTADVTRDEQVVAAVDQIENEMGRIDFLVHNAGGDIGRHTPRPDPNDAVHIKGEDVAWVVSVNLVGTINVCRAVAKVMERQGFGRIVAISSSDALKPTIDEGIVYAAAKAGIVHYTRNLAKYMRPYEVTVNAIAPGPTIAGRFLATRHVPEEVLAKKEGLDRLAWPEDQAKVIEFLLSPLADYVSGQVITVDGGRF